MEAVHINKSYKVKCGEPVQALKDINLNLPSKGLIFIVGESGSGKSTLLNILGGLDIPDSGNLIIDGKNIEIKDFAAYRNSCCGFIFQEYNLIPELSVKENIALALELQGKKNVNIEVTKVLKKVGLSGTENRRVNELSGGQRQRVTIARALIKKPDIILADEPTGALDDVTGEKIIRLLKEIAEEKLVIIVSHNHSFAAEYADRIIQLDDGKITEADEVAENCGQRVRKEYQKSALPVKQALKIGFSNFKAHPVKLFMIILLSVIAFTLLGIAVNIAMFNSIDTHTAALYDSGVTQTYIRKYEIIKDGSYIDSSLDKYFGVNIPPMRDTKQGEEDIDLFSSVTYEPLVLAYFNCISPAFQKYIAAGTTKVVELGNGSDKDYAITADGYIHLSEDAANAYGLTVIGRLPENSGEIAINGCMYNSFAVDGIIQGKGIVEINSPEDILGCKTRAYLSTLEEQTITGVVFTDCDKNYRADKDLHDKIFVSTDCLVGLEQIMTNLPENREDFKKLASFIKNYNDGNYLYKLCDEISTEFSTAELYAIFIKNLFAYISVAFLVIALLILINFIACALRDQFKQIGILSSMGARFTDLCKIYFSCMLILCAIIFAFSVGLSAFGIMLVNNHLISGQIVSFKLFFFSPVCVFALLGVILATVFIGCMLPLLKLKNKMPAEIIKRD